MCWTAKVYCLVFVLESFLASSIKGFCRLTHRKKSYLNLWLSLLQHFKLFYLWFVIWLVYRFQRQVFFFKRLKHSLGLKQTQIVNCFKSPFEILMSTRILYTYDVYYQKGPPDCFLAINTWLHHRDMRFCSFKQKKLPSKKWSIELRQEMIWYVP